MLEMGIEAPEEQELRLLLHGYYHDTLGIPSWREAAARRMLNRLATTIVARLNRYISATHLLQLPVFLFQDLQPPPAV